jgi:hypothetical protein
MMTRIKIKKGEDEKKGIRRYKKEKRWNDVINKTEEEI